MIIGWCNAHYLVTKVVSHNIYLQVKAFMGLCSPQSHCQSFQKDIMDGKERPSSSRLTRYHGVRKVLCAG